MIVLNFKIYKESTRERALALAKICDDVAKDSKVPIIVCPTAFDIERLRKAVGIPLYMQHLDDISPGAHTGFLSPEAAREAGATGTILNHSEHPLPQDVLSSTVSKVKLSGLAVIVCAKSIEEVEFALSLTPDHIALEIPELIGSNTPITEANPALIEEAVAKVGQGKLLIGSGIRSAEDVEKALSLGALGVLISSGFALAQNPKEVIISLAHPFTLQQNKS